MYIYTATAANAYNL